MHSAALLRQPQGWLAENGPRELELLFRAIVYSPAAPILIADDDRYYRDASARAGKLLGLPPDKVIGCRMDDFAAPSFRPKISQLWEAFLEKGEQNGTLQLMGVDGGPRDVEYTFRGNVLPVRHVLVLQDKTGTTAGDAHPAPAWVQDYALFLLDVAGHVVAWYAGAERIYGYPSQETIGIDTSLFYLNEDARRKVQEEMKRAAAQGHAGTEGWQVKKDGSRFWANVITMALRDQNDHLQGFARVVRDFSGRQARDEKLRRARSRIRQLPSES